MSNPLRIVQAVGGFETAGPTSIREKMARNNNVPAGATYLDWEDGNYYAHDGRQWRLVGPTTPVANPVPVE